MATATAPNLMTSKQAAAYLGYRCTDSFLAAVKRERMPIIRINSQSGKGGVAYVLEHEYGFQLPKLMHMLETPFAVATSSGLYSPISGSSDIFAMLRHTAPERTSAASGNAR